MLDSFRSRLVLSNLLITLIGLLVIVFVFTQVLADRSRSVKEKDLTADSAFVAAEIESVFRSHGSVQALRPVVYNASKALHVRIVVVGPQGGVVVDSKQKTPYFTGSWHPLDTTALKQARSARQTLRSTSLERFQSPLAGTRGHEIGAVLLVAAVSAVNPTIASLAGFIFVVLGTALLVWVVIGLYFTFSISRPLLKITNATVHMARGKYDTRVPVEGQSEIARLAGSFNDMAEKVQTTNRLLKDFVANVSHDLRTPLTMIAGFSQALLDGTARPEEAKESSQVIHDEALKMQGFVDDLLRLTRLESGLFSFRREAISPRPFFQEVIDRLSFASGDSLHVSIRNLAPADLPDISVDPEQLERGIRNLVDNGLRFTPPGGTISIDARPQGQKWVEISVSDTGVGIAAQDLDRVFERFYRADRGRDRGEGNSGLGLAIVREIVEGHGGEIRVESAPGNGTTFRFTVPCVEVASRQKEESVVPKPIRRAASR